MNVTRMKADELILGDRINLAPDAPYAYCYATVQEVTEDRVICLRPYVHHADFTCGNKVITYLGWEEVPLYKGSSDREVMLLERSVLK